MSSNFQTAFTKLSLLGHDKNALLDCSEVIVRPTRQVGTGLTMRNAAQGTAPPATAKQAFFPPGKTHADIEQGVRAACFPDAVLRANDAPAAVRDAAVPDDPLDRAGPADEDSHRVRAVSVPRLIARS